MLPNLRESTTVYLLTKNIAIANKVASHFGIEDYDTVFIGTNYKQYVRGRGNRTLYVCGEGHTRKDFEEILHHAKSLNWKIINGLPSRRTAS